jgi:hypothetical protein
MTLAVIQRGLAEVIRTGATTSGDEYVRSVVGSDRVDLLREIVLWWRTFGVQRACPLTSRLLLRQDRLDGVVAQFVADHSISPYIEDLAQTFVDSLRQDDDSLVAAVASFEAAIIRVKRGNRDRHVIEWPTEPYGVLGALLGDGPLPPPTGASAWTIVSAELPRRFEVLASAPAGHG